MTGINVAVVSSKNEMKCFDLEYNAPPNLEIEPTILWLWANTLTNLYYI